MLKKLCCNLNSEASFPPLLHEIQMMGYTTSILGIVLRLTVETVSETDLYAEYICMYKEVHIDPSIKMKYSI